MSGKTKYRVRSRRRVRKQEKQSDLAETKMIGKVAKSRHGAGPRRGNYRVVESAE